MVTDKAVLKIAITPSDGVEMVFCRFGVYWYLQGEKGENCRISIKDMQEQSKMFDVSFSVIRWDVPNIKIVENNKSIRWAKIGPWWVDPQGNQKTPQEMDRELEGIYEVFTVEY